MLRRSVVDVVGISAISIVPSGAIFHVSLFAVEGVGLEDGEDGEDRDHHLAAFLESGE